MAYDRLRQTVGQRHHPLAIPLAVNDQRPPITVGEQIIPMAAGDLGSTQARLGGQPGYQPLPRRRVGE
jgi:hypothetical protein